MNKTKNWRIGVLLALTIAAQASAGLLNLTDYNAVAFGDLNISNDQSEGKIAAGGDITLTSFNVGYGAEETDYSLIAGGSITLVNGVPVHNGGIFAGGSVTGANASDVEGTITQYGVSSASPIDFTSLKSEAQSLSQQLSLVTSNGTVTNNYGNVTLTGTSSDYNYFSIDVSLLSSSYVWTLSVPTGSHTVINLTNLSGSTFSTNYLSFTNFDASEVLFNIYTDANDISTLNLYGTYYGSILAPNANLSINNGNYYGTIIAESISGAGELHLAESETPPSDVPESSVSLMMAFGVCALACATRKKFAFTKK